MLRQRNNAVIMNKLTDQGRNITKENKFYRALSHVMSDVETRAFIDDFLLDKGHADATLMHIHLYKYVEKHLGHGDNKYTVVALMKQLVSDSIARRAIVDTYTAGRNQITIQT